METNEKIINVSSKDFTHKAAYYFDWYDCPICDDEFYIGNNYCPNCGTRINWIKTPKSTIKSY